MTYPADLFTVAGGAENTDWKFDAATGTLTILTDKELTISGGTATNGIDYFGNIVIADGVDAKLTLDGVTLDTRQKPGSQAGITIGDGCDVKITVADGTTNTINGSGVCAGIQLTGNYIYQKDEATQKAENDALQGSSVIIDLKGGELTVTGGTDGHRGGAGIGAAWASDNSKNNITIQGSGTLTANGGMGGAGIGGSEGGDIGNIVIDGGGLDITALGGDHGAGIGGGGWVAVYADGPQDVNSITITGDVTINTSSTSHGTGIGSGCHGTVGTITIGSDDVNADNSNIVIDAKGGHDGAAIGGGWDSEMKEIIIHGGNITATAGNNGAGIGSGYDSLGGKIVINGGVINATGSTNASGIGGGMRGTIEEITINGGTITADGGWTNDGGNIGGYTNKENTDKVAVTITNPNDLTIKAGEKGEGKYITTGTTDKDGNELYSLDMAYVAGLALDGRLTPLPVDTVLAFPLKTINVTTTPSAMTYAWDDIRHMSEDSAYIWMKNENIKLTFEDANGVKGSVDLTFFPDYGLWRLDAADLPDELPKEPGYVDTAPPQQPGQPGQDQPVLQGGAIIIQAGAYRDERIYIPRFYFSYNALGLGELNIATQNNAQESMEKLGTMVDRVSEIRAQYGALQNTLSHISDHLGVNIENLTESVSVIRDTDMAEEMMAYTKNNILTQSVQAMLAQANQAPQGMLQLMQ